MPATVVLPLPEGDVFAARRKRWTRDECYDLLRLGKLPEGKFELIEGEIVIKMPQQPARSYPLEELRDRLSAIFAPEFVRAQLPLVVDSLNEPEPDLVVTTRPRRDFRFAHPEAEDVRLVVEIAHTSRREDTSVKAALYARQQIGDYWVLDVERRALVVFREPADGAYRSVVSYSEDESISPLAAPEASVRVGDLLP